VNSIKNAKLISYSQQTYASIIVNLFLHLKWYYPIMPVNFYLELKRFFSAWLHPDSFSRGGECHRPWYWRETYPDYGASN